MSHCFDFPQIHQNGFSISSKELTLLNYNIMESQNFAFVKVIKTIAAKFGHPRSEYAKPEEKGGEESHLFQTNCAPGNSQNELDASCMNLAISYFALLSQPLLVLCLFEKVY